MKNTDNNEKKQLICGTQKQSSLTYSITESANIVEPQYSQKMASAHITSAGLRNEFILPRRGLGQMC